MSIIFFSISSSILFISLFEKNGECLALIKKENHRLHSENFLTNLRKILNDSNKQLSSIEKIYLTTSPGGQTGIRVSLAFISAIQILNDKIEIFHINSLFFQSGLDSCISSLSIDSKKTKYYVSLYEKEKCLLNEKIVSIEQLKNISFNNGNLIFKSDLNNVDFLENFKKMIKHFKRLKSVDEVKY